MPINTTYYSIRYFFLSSFNLKVYSQLIYSLDNVITMEGIQTKHKILNDEIYNLDVINILKDINVSAFIDKWGPTDVLQVYDPEIKMQGFLVIDNLALGTGCGELRISSNIIPHRIFQQARSMTWICALSNINFGGAAAAIRANTDNINKIEFVKSFAREVSPFVPNQYVAAPSIDIGKCEMAAFVEEIGIRKGATGKPKGMGGIPRELGVIGFGMGVAIETTIEASQYLSTFPTDISDAKIALQGFDVIGATIAKYLARKGAKKVYAYEPLKEQYQLLVDNVKINNFNDIIIPFNFAIQGKTGSVYIKPVKNLSGSSKTSLKEEGQGYWVKAITLNPDIEILKIDCEGCEYDILNHLILEKTNIEEIIMECHNNLNKLIPFFEKQHYKYKILKEKNNLGIIFAQKS